MGNGSTSRGAASAASANSSAVGDGPAALTLELAAPCIGIPYAGQLLAQGGGGEPYTWQQVTALPAGLSLDVAGAITGIPTAVGSFTAVVTDRAAKASQPIEFTLSQRQTCTFAYVSQDAEPAQLHYRDVFLSSRTQVNLPAAPVPGELVADFKFSPDGQWIAFRVGALNDFRLALYSTARGDSGELALDATPVTFGCTTPSPSPTCSVLDYAWSDDSQYLAAILSGPSPTQDYLAGLDVKALEAPWAIATTATGGGVEIPLDYRAQLVWAAGGWLGFVGADPDAESGQETEKLYYAVRGQDGQSWETVRATGEAFGQASLRSVPSGLILAHERTDELQFFTRGQDLQSGDDDAIRPYWGRLSPSGQLAALANTDGRLQVSDLAEPGAIPIESDRDACGEIVAWSEHIAAIGLDRIACKSGDDLNVFDYLDPPAQADSDPPPRMTLLAQTRFTEPLSGARRAFSPSAKWLVLGAREAQFFLWEVSAEGKAPAVIYTDSSADMEFAQARDIIAFSGADSLVEYRLPRSVGGVRAYATFGGTATFERCDEPVLERWCGAPRITNHLAYGQDSQSLLFEGPSGVLWLADTSADPPTEAAKLSDFIPACAPTCKGDVYAFKP